ncbi:MAG TPA: chlorite dismutase family protein [Gemmatimonadales bacterium]|nr:chlorite dismutase family protein [Gemmatimonadales bacterium]
MAEPTPETLNHFAMLSFTDSYWQLSPESRRATRDGLLSRLRATADAVHLYQLSALESQGDLLVWSATASASPGASARFFAGWAAAIAPARAHIRPSDVLWGYTRPSQYTKTRSTQELDAFAPSRQQYLIVYPFVKTAEWYQLDREKRQNLMAGHIRIGTQYKDITQLLLYSFGLQDQEFVVVYETEDMLRFLALVQELRGAEARVYTARDWPLHVGIYQPGAEALASWL